MHSCGGGFLTPMNTMDLTTVEYKLGRIEGKVDMILATRQEDMDREKVLEGRVDSLEKFRWTLLGGATTISILVSFALNTVIWHK